MSQIPVSFGELKGVYHGAGPGPAFACIHGLTLNHDMFAELSEAAQAAGISVLRFHLRGHFDSGGKLEEQGFNDELDDALAALNFLQKQAGIDPARIGLLGFSLGGAVAAVASTRFKLKALATWGSLLNTRGWTDSRYTQYGKPENGIVRIWDQIAVSERLFSEAEAADPFQNAVDFDGPYLAAHGGRDRNHPQSRSIEVVQKRKEAGRMAEGYFPERSGHKFQVPEDRKILNEITLNFFKAAL